MASAKPIDAGDVVIVAIGPLPNRDIVPEVERAGAPYVLAGDCNQIGDFLAAVTRRVDARNRNRYATVVMAARGHAGKSHRKALH